MKHLSHLLIKLIPALMLAVLVSTLSLVQGFAAEKNSPDTAVTGIEQQDTVETQSKSLKKGRLGAAAIPSLLKLEWTDTANGSTVQYDSDGTLVIEPTAKYPNIDYGLPGNQIHCHLTMSLGGDVNAKPGEIEIRIPNRVFRDEAGNPYGSFEIGVSDRPAGTTGFYYTLDEATNEIVLKNYVEIPTAYEFHCDITYKPGYPSWGTADGYSKAFHADFSLRKDGQPVASASSNDLSFRVNLPAKLDAAGKTQYQKYEVWQDGWGSKPADADQYFYLVWGVAATTLGPQPYALQFTDTPGQGTEVIGWAKSPTAALAPGNEYYDAEPLTNRSYSQSGRNSRSFFVVTRTPKSLADATGSTTVTNECKVEMFGRDGAHGIKDATGSYTYKKPDPFTCPKGAFSHTKSRSDETAKGYKTKVELAEDGESAGTLFSPTYKTDFRVATTTRGLYLTLPDGEDPTQYDNYGKQPYYIETTDDLLYLAGSMLDESDYQFEKWNIAYTEYDYQQNPDTGVWTYVDNKDYENYGKAEIQIRKKGESGWTVLGSVTKDSEGAFFTPANSSAPGEYLKSAIDLPADTVAIRAVNETKKANCSISLYVGVALKNTAHVRELLAKSETPQIYNVSTYRVLDANGTWVNTDVNNSLYGFMTDVPARDKAQYGSTVSHATHYIKLSEFEPKAVLNKSVTATNNAATGKVRLQYKLSIYQQIDPQGMSLDQLIDFGLFAEQTEGTFYDLLPLGAVPDLSSIKVKRYDGSCNATFDYDIVRTVDNWRGSGRTLLVVHAKRSNTESNVFYASYTAVSGITMEFDAYYSHEALYDFGSPLNEAGYESYDRMIGSAVGKDEYRNPLLSDLDDDGVVGNSERDWVYGSAKATLTFPAASELSFSKKVLTPRGANYTYTNTGKVLGGDTYSYKLRMGSQSGQQTKDIIMYDELESYTDDNIWKGTFAGVDTVHAELKGIAPVVYYSTISGLDLKKGSPNLDLTDTAIWSKTPPADLSKVTAVAFDLRKNADGTDFVLPPLEAVSVNIYMNAPTENIHEYVENNSLAVNCAWESSTVISSSGVTDADVLECQPTTVSIIGPNAEIHKTSDPVTGTKDAPTKLSKGDALCYSLKVENTETKNALTNLVVEDVIPDGLAIDKKAVSWNMPEGVAVTYDGQKVIFTIAKLPAANAVTFKIPTTVETDAAMVFANTAEITKINDLQYGAKSETTYHETDPEFIVTYVVTGDPAYGTPSDGTAPTDDNNPYKYKDSVTVKEDLTTS